MADAASGARRRTRAKTSRTRKAPTPAASAAEYDPARPDIILFNGGFFASPVLRERLLEVLKGWFPSKSKKAWSPIVLDHDRLAPVDGIVTVALVLALRRAGVTRHPALRSSDFPRTRREGGPATIALRVRKLTGAARGRDRAWTIR